jgi:hypothetical protein
VLFIERFESITFSLYHTVIPLRLSRCNIQLRVTKLSELHVWSARQAETRDLLPCCEEIDALVFFLYSRRFLLIATVCQKILGPILNCSCLYKAQYVASVGNG